eukprot:33250-Chlamydomonas_euryale.AAC.1
MSSARAIAASGNLSLAVPLPTLAPLPSSLFQHTPIAVPIAAAAEAVYEDAAFVCIVMELCAAGDLSAALGGGRLGERTAARVVAQMAAALAHVHSCGFVHRDVSFCVPPPQPVPMGSGWVKAVVIWGGSSQSVVVAAR